MQSSILRLLRKVTGPRVDKIYNYIYWRSCWDTWAQTSPEESDKKDEGEARGEADAPVRGPTEGVGREWCGGRLDTAVGATVEKTGARPLRHSLSYIAVALPLSEC